MISHTGDLQRIKDASSLEEIQRVVRRYSGEAPAGSRGGILYSGRVGQTKSEVIALEIADLTGQPVINRTPRAQFLVAAEREITESAIRIYELQGESFALAKQSATSFLYGDAHAPIHGQTSLDGCLWGETSREFAGSLHGEVTLVASEAQMGRVFAAAEVPAALENGNISSIGGHSTDSLRQLARHGDASRIIKLTQERFIKAAPHGVFVSPKNVGPEISKVIISKEVAASLGLDPTPFSSNADLTAAGLKRVSTFAAASPHVTANPASSSPGQGAQGTIAAANATDELSLALEAERRFATAAKGAVAGSAAALMAADAYTTAQKYQALSAQGNEFGADALLRRYEGRTAGGFLGSLAAGATYGFVAGSETGPGAFLTGAAGGVIGAFAGEEIAKAINEHEINHQTGTDGVTYAYEDGQWGRTHHHVDLSSSGPTNPYDAPNYTSTTTPAPDNQIEVLEYKRMTAVTELALANPAAQDTRHIELDGTSWHAAADGWAQQMQIPGVPNTYGIPSFITVDQPADAKTSETLNRIAANRRYNNDHYASDVANAYVMDYYGKGWAAHGALPDAVTKPLGLPGEQRIKDPVTGHVWNATVDCHFSREVDRSAGRVFIRETVQASGEELNRLSHLLHSAMQSNADYGKRLIAEKFEESGIAQYPAHAAHADGTLPTATDPGFHGNTPSNPSPSFEITAAPKAVSSVTPQSSNREMFAALVTATQHVDIDAMRAVGQAYLQSERGQAWLAQGQQFNQQQAQAQQQAARDAQQHVSAPQGAMR